MINRFLQGKKKKKRKIVAESDREGRSDLAYQTNQINSGLFFYV